MYTCSEPSLENCITGTCSEMCSESERRFRQRERLLHRLELKQGENPKYGTQDSSLVIKCYSRPAAGQKPAQPSDIRTCTALTNTIDYLIRHIITRNDVDWVVIYDFVFDRLRAVRQDMVMQGLRGLACITMLEEIVRFHVYAGYRLCEEPISKYDPTINKTHLRECLTRLLVLYEEEENTTFKNRSEMEALNLTENLGISNVLHRACGLAKLWRTPVVDQALDMSLASWMGNYKKACRIMKTLPPLQACSASLHLPEIRRRALQVMSKAYNSVNGSYPVTKLQDVLLFETDEDALKECAHYNIQSVCKESNWAVIFNKNTFNAVIKAPLPRHRTAANEALSVRSVDLLLKGEITTQN